MCKHTQARSGCPFWRAGEGRPGEGSRKSCHPSPTTWRSRRCRWPCTPAAQPAGGPALSKDRLIRKSGMFRYSAIYVQPSRASSASLSCFPLPQPAGKVSTLPFQVAAEACLGMQLPGVLVRTILPGSHTACSGLATSGSQEAARQAAQHLGCNTSDCQAVPGQPGWRNVATLAAGPPACPPPGCRSWAGKPGSAWGPCTRQIPPGRARTFNKAWTGGGQPFQGV